MKSMTGYGRGTVTANGVNVTVEVSSVNSKKQLELHCSVPRELGMLEPEMRAVVQKKLVRGTVNAVVNYRLASDNTSAVPLNEPLALATAKRLGDFAKACGLPAPTLREILLVPGVLQSETASLETVKPLVMQALEQALDALCEARLKEGSALFADLEQRGKNMQELLNRIIAREQEAQTEMLRKLKERIAQLGVELPIDDERLAKELAFYVDKSDITEETVRLNSHLSQYRTLIAQENDSGRNLDFLCQEMTRESNTLAAKTADLSISADALALKIEVSKVKEQILNVE